MTLRRFPTAPSGSLFPSALFFTVCVFQSALSRLAPGAQDVFLMPRRCGAFRPHLLTPRFRPPCFLQSAFFKAPVTPRPKRSARFPYALTLQRLPPAPSQSRFSPRTGIKKRPPQRRRPACSKKFFLCRFCVPPGRRSAPYLRRNSPPAQFATLWDRVWLFFMASAASSAQARYSLFSGEKRTAARKH